MGDKNVRCFCGVKECDTLRLEAQTHAPVGHVWRECGTNGLTQIAFRPHELDVNPFTLAMRRVVTAQFDLTVKKSQAKTFYISLTHWHPDLLERRRHISGGRSRIDVKTPFDTTESAHTATRLYLPNDIAGSTNDGFAAQRYNVHEVLQTESLECDSKWKNQYVQAPILPIESVRLALKQWKRKDDDSDATMDETTATTTTGVVAVEPVNKEETTKASEYIAFAHRKGERRPVADMDFPSKPGEEHTAVDNSAGPNKRQCIVADIEHEMATKQAEAQAWVQNVDSVLTLDNMTRYVHHRAAVSLYEAAPLRGCPQWMAVLNHLRYSLRVTRVKLDRHTLYICPSYGSTTDNCQGFLFRTKYTAEGDVRCEVCTKTWYRAQDKERRKAKRLLSGVDHTKADSKCPIDHLSVEELKIRMANVIVELRKARTTIRSLERQVEDYEGVTETVLKEVESLQEDLCEVEAHLTRTAPKTRVSRRAALAMTERPTASNNLDANRVVGIHPSAFGGTANTDKAPMATLESLGAVVNGIKFGAAKSTTPLIPAPPNVDALLNGSSAGNGGTNETSRPAAARGTTTESTTRGSYKIAYLSGWMQSSGASKSDAATNGETPGIPMHGATVGYEGPNVSETGATGTTSDVHQAAQATATNMTMSEG